MAADAVAVSGFDSLDAAAERGTAYVFLGHGTSHSASVAYSQTQAAVAKLGYKNVWIGTVEGKPETTACDRVIDAVAAAGFRNVVLRPLMVVAGDHAKNDMASDGPDSWKSRIEACGFKAVPVLKGLGEYPGVRKMFCRHARNAEAAE